MSAAVQDDHAVAGGTAGVRSPLVRVTVNLTARSYGDLERLSEATGLGKTDVINRALQVYSLVESLLDERGGCLTTLGPAGEREKIYIL